MLAIGTVADRIGRRRVFQAGIALFALASVVCTFATPVLVLDLALLRHSRFMGISLLPLPVLLPTHLPYTPARSWWGDCGLEPDRSVISYPSASL
ncbi:hypothetical protein Aph01nite_45790 [Acrocarpospora phusangensis]|uniref:Major facilitator superfamily (MFS) profile domain-containing protein n=2 Tax=Acrocarpospora phusangensis TaxID=1070424 RepID=A0A919ULS4_9ACTN|nr:hypothetical protein Aph01nite_45790 [Acrocarpospora phusangensis]